MVIEKADEQLL